eukprot:CAMPEP_0180638180 /NCGR_PEP_ID=MMETSP1037_2-20121125/44154_1 /TAXON_ID=632150 /ORGANISM="Azadinium spinosum, Strain 3D9" /LENGTH=214 /DNA_ID=CAMNT_0022659625 /DNA_START=224 /DNA_END=865 /DNA_ORIENTATION=+
MVERTGANLTDLQRIHEDEKEELNERFKQKLEAHAQEIRDLVSAHNKKLEAERRRAYNEGAASCAREISDLQQENTKLNLQLEQENEKLRREHLKKVDDLKRELEKAKSLNEKVWRVPSEECKRKVKSLNRDHEQRIQRIKEEVNKQKEEELARMERQHKKDIKFLTEVCAKKADELERRFQQPPTPHAPVAFSAIRAARADVLIQCVSGAPQE